MSQTKKRNIIIGALCTVLLLMVVGYAAFQSVLKINGTTNINSNWDVKITAIEQTASLGATDKEAPTYDNTKGLSATFNTNLTSPGDYATYKITITNSGSLDAVLKNITIPENTNNDILFYLNKDQNDQDIEGALKQDDTLTKASESNNVGYVYVTVLYKDYANQQTAETKTASMTISFDFEQKTSGAITGGIASDYTGILYSKNVLTGEDFTEANYIYPEDSVDKIKGYAKEDSSILGNYYLKHIMTNGQVESSELCFVTDTEHCMKPNEYETSKALIQSQESWFTANGGSCAFNDSYSSCYAVSLIVDTPSDGNVRAADGSVNCSVDAAGSAGCFAY